MVVEGGSAEVDICKKVMTPKGRAVELRRVRAGDVVKFRIRVTNLGTDVADDVLVCDLVPRGLVLVRASVKVTYRRDRVCGGDDDRRGAGRARGGRVVLAARHHPARGAGPTDPLRRVGGAARRRHTRVA